LTSDMQPSVRKISSDQQVYDHQRTAMISPVRRAPARMDDGEAGQHRRSCPETT
jgi:hypothetical protein